MLSNRSVSDTAHFQPWQLKYQINRIYCLHQPVKLQFTFSPLVPKQCTTDRKSFLQNIIKWGWPFAFKNELLYHFILSFFTLHTFSKVKATFEHQIWINFITDLHFTLSIFSNFKTSMSVCLPHVLTCCVTVEKWITAASILTMKAKQSAFQYIISWQLSIYISKSIYAVIRLQRPRQVCDFKSAEICSFMQ